jgi:hypothetical protein
LFFSGCESLFRHPGAAVSTSTFLSSSRGLLYLHFLSFGLDNPELRIFSLVSQLIKIGFDALLDIHVSVLLFNLPADSPLVGIMLIWSASDFACCAQFFHYIYETAYRDMPTTEQSY